MPIDANYCPYCGSKILAVNDVQKLLCTVFGLTLGESSLQEVAKVCELDAFSKPNKLRYKHPNYVIYYYIDKQLLSEIQIYNIFSSWKIEEIGRIPDEWRGVFGDTPHDWTIEKVISFFPPYFDRYDIGRGEGYCSGRGGYRFVDLIFESNSLTLKFRFDNLRWDNSEKRRNLQLEKEYEIESISISLNKRCQ